MKIAVFAINRQSKEGILERMIKKLISRHWLDLETLYIYFSNGTYSVWSSLDKEDPQFIGSYNDCLTYVNDAISDYMKNSL